jgi:hypothetical protein
VSKKNDVGGGGGGAGTLKKFFGISKPQEEIKLAYSDEDQQS